MRQNLRTSYNRLNKANISSHLLIYVGGTEHLIIYDDSGMRQKGIGKSEKSAMFDDIARIYSTRHTTRYNRSSVKEWLLEKYHYSTKTYKEYKNAMTFVLVFNERPVAFMSGYRSREKNM